VTGVQTCALPISDGLMENIVGVTEYLRGIIARQGATPRGRP